MVGGGHQGVVASLQELVVRKVGNCLGVEEVVQRNQIVAHLRILLVLEGEARACLVEH